MAVVSLLAAASGLTLMSAPPAHVQARSAVHMAIVDDFAISRTVKDVLVFDGDYASEIRDKIADVGADAIATKGSFSLAIPGGSVVKAFGELSPDAFDMSKMHVFLCNEKIPSYPCIDGALEVTKVLGVPDENVHGFDKEASPAAAAAKYTELLKSHPSIGNEGAIPSVDMMLLGTGPDGHCGCLFPDSPEIKATGSGAVVLAGNNENADGDFVAITMDVMNAAKVVIVSAAAAARAPMVAKALSGEFGAFDCPAGMVDAAEETLWFVDEESIGEFDGLDELDEGELDGLEVAPPE